MKDDAANNGSIPTPIYSTKETHNHAYPAVTKTNDVAKITTKINQNRLNGTNTYQQHPHYQDEDLQQPDAPSPYNNKNFSANETVAYQPDTIGEACAQEYFEYQPRKEQFEKHAQRSVLFTHLPEYTTHADVVAVVQGGVLLDIHLRSYERSAAVSFLHAAAAQDFLRNARRHDIYIKNKRVGRTKCRSEHR